MIVLLSLLACTGSRAPARPDGVPAQAIAIHLDESALTVDGARVDSAAALEQDLVNGIHDPLLAALEQVPGEEAWISVPGDTPWMIVRKLVVTANEAGRSRRWVSDGGPAFGPSGMPAARFMPGCADTPIAVDGVARRVVVELFDGSDGTWVEAGVQFSPRVDGAAAIALPPQCWQTPGCASLGNHEAVCTAALTDVAPARVQVAGPIGCMLPIRKQPGDEARWPDELATNLKGLGIGPGDEATLVIEANVPFSAVTAVMLGFERAGLPAPALGMPLVEGHGRPPPCTAQVRDATTLEIAGAKWFGGQIGGATATPVAQPPG